MEDFAANIQSQIQQNKYFTPNHRGRGEETITTRKRASLGLPKASPVLDSDWISDKN